MAECHQETGYFPIDSLPLEVIELIRAQCDPATLLSWSSTCHFYRGLLRLHVFEQITIGPKIPPTRVVEALSGNFHVLSLEFTCEADRHSHQAKEDSKAGGNVGGQRSPKDLISSEMLGQVLRQFPEDLANLTLRFPEKWIAKDNLCWPREFAFEEEQPLTDIERNNLHNDLLWTTLDSMAKNNISSQRVFRLQLLNISPHVSGVYHQPCFRNFLRKITSFVLELCRFERHWRHRPLERTWYRYLLSGWFYDQLQRVEDFSFFATPIWSDTLLSDSRHVYSTLSPKAEQLPNLKHLTLSTVMIDPNLIAFLTSKCHAQNIESISLHDCFCHATIHDYGTPLGDAEYDASECPTWATLFDRLVAQRPPNLTSFTISYGPWQLEEKMACYYQEGHETKHCSLASTMNPQMCKTLMAAAVLDADCQERSRLTRVPCDQHFHRSLMLLYSRLCPMVSRLSTACFGGGATETCTRFLEGSDLQAWKSLAELMVTNGGRNVQMH
ncbi:hypothetical protein EDD36DRAFT_297914 [Exophiala viscosa]|uniref:F-box domain-containing protein n=1 Tax=Exophiala viscosa TaxID=2486360 RepID=A0AAN6DU79_9EURO|nr:hypothetical protein EDD36DRAFT_297914 [Exophiala viscosa]